MTLATLPYRLEENPQPRGRPSKSNEPIPSYIPSGRPSENGRDFRRENDCHWAIRYRPPELPPSPRDENLVFVTNCTPSEPTLPLQTAGQRADCRGRGFQFSSRIFLLDDGFPDPLHVAASFAHLEFSYRTIPLRRIRFAYRLTAGAKFVRDFRQEMRKPVTPEVSQTKKDGATLLTKIAPLFVGGSDLPRLWVRCGIDTACEVCGLACGSFSLLGMNDRHFQDEENEPHSENDKITVIRKGSPPTNSEMIIISVILK